MERRVALARLAAGGKRRLSAPQAPKVMSVGPAGVTLRWSAPKGTKPAAYQVLRDGRVLARTTHRSFTDTGVMPGKTYRYAIRGVDSHGRRGLLSGAVRVPVPKRSTNPVARPPGTVPATGGSTPVIAPIEQGSPPGSAPTPDPTATPTPTPTPTPVPTPDPNAMTAAMVDRLFWRAGFGASDAQRAAWVGKLPEELVDWFLDTPPSQETATPPPLTSANGVIDPLASDDECVMEWLDTMQRVDNPLPERLAFFLHRHWAVSVDDGIPLSWLVAYRNRLRGFADDPNISFRKIAYDMSTLDAAMSMYLNGSSNIKGSPNENYAREFMELFCLGPTGPDGTPNYVQADVAGLARAFTGWRLDSATGVVTFTPRYFEPSAKTFLNQTIPAAPTTTGRPNLADGIACMTAAVNTVLAQPNHAQFLIRKLWAEFIASPIPQATLDDLVAQYRAGDKLLLRPVIRGILTHPLIFESLTEPNLVKPPVVYAVGLLRALGAPMKANHLRVALDNMQQRPYRPPNVAGWEGGLSWLNSNTVQARFDAIVRVQYLKYSTYYPGQVVPTIPVESAQATFARAYAAAGSPWLSDGTRTTLMAYANAAPVTNDAQRRQRFYTLQALMLGGPDGQVM